MTLIFISGLLGCNACSAEKSSETQVVVREESAGVNNMDWRPLFDGSTLSGWRGFKNNDVPLGWIVEDGMMSLAEPGGGDIMTVDTFEEFELEFEWRISNNGNSGVIYLVNETESTGHTYQTGLEFQVLDDAGHRDGQDKDHRAGSLYDLVAPSSAVANPVGEFNLGRIIVHDGRIEHWLNGEKIVESPYGDDSWRAMVAGSKFVKMPEFGTFPGGHIAFQDHGDKVWYRNIRIREL